MSNPLEALLTEAEPLTLGQALDAIAEYVSEMRDDPHAADVLPTSLSELLTDIGVWVEAVAVTAEENR
jgi:hypothetical protein